ncbi:hypothetical protein [Modestobacter sp. NPDC049651]|uniref:hypothetical protein n=1 Tax=unclassified Modestobacter TaxID=2643866 RepID=UPI0033DFD2CC
MTSADWDPPEPYTGPPRYEGGRPPVWAAPTWGPPPQQWGQQQWGQQPHWGPPQHWAPLPPPSRPRRPGTVVAAAVLAYVSAVLVLLGTLWGLLLSGLLALAGQLPLGFGPVMAGLQLALIGLLVTGATRALGLRRRWLLAALVLQLALAGWWWSTLGGVSDLVSDGGVAQLPWLFAGLAVVAAGLAWSAELTRWTARGRDHLRARRGRQGA